MHRIILMAPPGAQVDHKNGDGLDNRRDNIRSASSAQNQMNKPKNRRSKSPYKGITFDKSTGQWQAQIKAEGQTRYLGQFPDAILAAKAYDAAATKYFGEFAFLNFSKKEGGT